MTAEQTIISAIRNSGIQLTAMQIKLAIHSAQHSKRQGGKVALQLWVADFVARNK